jgi:hypothetical protein
MSEVEMKVESLDDDDYKISKEDKLQATNDSLEQEVQEALTILKAKGVTDVQVYCLLEKKKTDNVRIFRIPLNCLRFLPTISLPCSQAQDLSEPLGIDILTPDIFDVVLEYVMIFKDGEKQPKPALMPCLAGGMRYNTSEEEADFCMKLWDTMPRDDFFKVVEGSSYLQCSFLTKLLCCLIAMKMKETRIEDMAQVLRGKPLDQKVEAKNNA